MPSLPEDKLIPLKRMMLVEPIRPPKRISLLADIIETVESMPTHIKAKVIKFGPQDRPPDFHVGDVVVIPPHGGYMIPTPEGQPERMVIPVNDAVGVWEE